MKIILTGATGYDPLTDAEKAKLEEYIIPDFMDLKAGDKHFEGYDAVYFIAGITSIGTPENVYRRISYDIPTHFADIMPNKGQMTYIYLSGAGTDPAFAYRPALCFYPLMRLCGLANNMTEVAHSMLACTRDGYPHYAINPRDITKLAKQL